MTAADSATAEHFRVVVCNVDDQDHDPVASVFSWVVFDN